MKRSITTLAVVALLVPGVTSAQVEAVPISIQLPDACELTVGHAYKTADQPGVYYIAPGCKKRPMLSSRIYFSYFSSWREVDVIGSDVLERIEMHELGFLPWGPKRDFGSGSLLKTTDDPLVYLVINDEKRPLLTGEVFEALGFSYDQIEDVDHRVLEMFETGDPIDDVQDVPQGFMFRYEDDPAVYILEMDDEAGEVMKRQIMTMDDVIALGYRADRIAVLPPIIDFHGGDVVEMDQENVPEQEMQDLSDDPERYEVDFDCKDTVTGRDGTHAICIGDEFSHETRTFGFRVINRADHSSYIEITRISDVASVQVGEQVLVSDSVEQTAARLYDEDTRITIRYGGKDLAGKAVYTVRQRPL